MNAQNLLDKYIKYDSKITFDIFELMYQKLIDLGFITPHEVEDAFKEFSGKYNYFVMKVYGDELYFNQFGSAEKPKSEISVEDLLGYNPFKNLELPEKWCIKVTKENQKILSKWRTDGSCSIGHYLLSPYHSYSNGSKGKIGYSVPNIPEDTIEITFDQFKQYVLKEPVTTPISKKLPYRWCIELNKTTIPIVCNYYNKKYLLDPNCNTYTECAEGRYVRSHNNAGEYVKNGYNFCSFFNSPSDEYPEITLEEFKQIIMEETTSKPKIESKEDNPEYVECFFSASNTFTLNKIYKCCSGSTSDRLNLLSETGTKLNLPYEGSIWKFKPSTKEAFEMQTKPLEKWSVGSYVVPLQDRLLTRAEPLIKGKPYQIIKRSSVPYIMCEKGFEINFRDDGDTEIKEGIKWFATLKEAEEFAKTLIKFVEDSIECSERPKINTYGLNVGDKLDAIIIVAWEKQDFNYFSDSSEGWRFGNGAPYFGDRKIENFKVIDGVVGFLVSGTSGSYLRAEGFKEFAENYQLKSSSNFKVGSWYKYNGYYLKYSKTNDRNIFIASEYIDISHNEFKDKLINFTCGIADDSKELVKDLVVIQKYLPEGHPDKIIKNPIFEDGKWYRITDGKSKCIGKDIWYAKSIVVRDNIITAGEYWHNYLDTNGNFGNVGDYTFTEVPLSEIQHLLPEGHPDKIVKEAQKVIKTDTSRVRVTSSYIKILKI